MDFKKVTITLPKPLYEEAKRLVDQGLYSNFSDLIGCGIRQQFHEMKSIVEDIEESRFYKDQDMLKNIKKSEKEIKEGKGVILKTKKDVDTFLGAL